VLALGACLGTDAARRGVSVNQLAYLKFLLLDANGLACSSVFDFSIYDAVLAIGAALSDGRYLVAAFVEGITSPSPVV
jgi:hypothetical protein